MKSIRRVHGWLGVLFAPTIILFALTGMLQLYGLHDLDAGEQPGLVAKLAMIHTHQTASVPVRTPRPQPAPQPDAKPQPDRPKPEKHSTMPLKLLFTAMALALMTSSVLGVWIAFTSKRDRNLHIGLLAAGVVLPIFLLLV
jgi:hypothetical protein